MKASRLIFALLLASSVAVVQLAAQQTKADQKPIEEVKPKAEAGDADSQVELALRYEKGEGVAKDQTEAVKVVSQSRRTKFRQGSNKPGCLLRRRRRRDEGSGRGHKWFRKPAEQNYARAQYNLGVCFGAGAGVAKDPVEAAKWFRKAAEQNLAKAQYSLGVCYYKGEGVTKDQVEAMKWYRKAAERIMPMLNTIWASVIARRRRGEGSGGGGEVVSQSRRTESRRGSTQLGIYYLNGTGVAKDQVEAGKWYRKAAEQNDVVAQNNLGVCYANGVGVAKDPVEAVKWYRKAAKQNDAKAQYNLGVRYEHGEGVARIRSRR